MKVNAKQLSQLLNMQKQTEHLLLFLLKIQTARQW